MYKRQGTASIYDLEALEQNAAGGLNNRDSVQTTTKPKTTSQAVNTIGIKADEGTKMILLAFMIGLPLLVIGAASGNPFAALYCLCCFPEIWFFPWIGTTKKKEKKVGLGSEISGFWVVFFIALVCIFIIALF